MTTSSNLPDVDGVGPKLAQVDPPPSLARTGLRIVLAALFVSLAITAYFYFGRRTPESTGEVVRLSEFPVHTLIRGAVAGAPGMVGQDENYDQLLVFALVRLHNQSKAPLKVDDMWATIKLPNGEIRRSLAASDSDFKRVFAAYPQLSPIRIEPLRRDIAIAPGDSIDGLLVFNYPVTRAQWDTRQTMDVTISFANARELTLRAPQG